tara:strand:+ start:137 stop:517 length:381 start_codon:yes stop_codon:yes gene_type:complete
MKTFAVGCENIKNMDVTSVTKIMFAKSLMFGRRQGFCEKFKLNDHDIKEWNTMFKDLDDTLGIGVEQEIIEWEVHQQMIPIFKETWGFIKNVKITLNWDHEKVLPPISEGDEKEINKIANGVKIKL